MSEVTIIAAGDVPKLALNYNEAAQASGLSVKTIRKMASEGRIKVSYAGGRPVILTSTLYQLLKDHEVYRNKPGKIEEIGP